MIKCPTCQSPDPKLHPALQWEGEVHLCENAYHEPSADKIKKHELNGGSEE